MSNTDITINDIILWKDDIKKAKTALLKNDPTEIAAQLHHIANCMCFLVAFVLSNLKIEVDESVYDEARKMQERDYAKGDAE